MARRTLLLVVSILLAGLGTGLVGLYVRGADSRAQSDQQLVDVVVAAKPIAVGTSVAQADDVSSFKREPFRRRNVTAQMFSGPSALSQLTTAMTSAKLNVQVQAGQFILKGMLGATADAAQDQPSIGKFGVTISMSQSAQAAPLLTPGTLVSVFVTRKSPSGTSKTEQLMSPVKVLKIGGIGADGGASGQQSSGGLAGAGAGAGSGAAALPTTLVTLDLTLKQASDIINADANGALYLAVLGDQSKQPAGT